MKQTAQERIADELKEAFRKVLTGTKECVNESKYQQTYGYYKGLLRAYELITEESKVIHTNMFDMCAEAERISREEGVVQHVNKAADGVFVISDWKDDSTIMSFNENGNPIEL